jgi:hypothetical protein
MHEKSASPARQAFGTYGLPLLSNELAIFEKAGELEQTLHAFGVIGHDLIEVDLAPIKYILT